MRYTLLALVLVFFTACTSKQVFEPKSLAGDVKFDGDIPSKIETISYDGVTLENKNVITKDGVLDFNLPKDFFFLTKSDEYIIANSNCNILKIFEDKREIKSLEFKANVISASLQNELLALVLANNRVILYNIKKDKELFSQKQEDIFAIDSKVAKPFFLNDLVLFPTLDGKVVIVDLEQYRFIRDIVVSSDKFFSNVIFLSIVENRLIASTKKKVISVNPDYTNSKELSIKDIVVIDDDLYILTVDGRIILADFDLNLLKERKFEFAKFVGLINGKYIYLVEKEGYLIALDKSLLISNIFKLPEAIEDYVFTTGKNIYYLDKYFKLGN